MGCHCGTRCLERGDREVDEGCSIKLVFYVFFCLPLIGMFTGINARVCMQARGTADTSLQ
jgi:hypothetical protein